MQAGDSEWRAPPDQCPDSGRRHGAEDGGPGPEMLSPADFGARLQGDDGGMCEGPSRISGPIPPDPTLCPDYYRRPASGELVGAAADRGPSEARVCSTAEPHTPPRSSPQPKDVLREMR